MKKAFFISIVLLLTFIGCKEDEANLTSPDERVKKAVNDLRALLTEPDNGWVLNYQPTEASGYYYFLLDFDENEVNIKSDVPDEDGVYYDQTISYRLDAQLGIELVFENYGVFHFLFEQEQSTLGAEFEFIYLNESAGNLRFRSKSDFGTDITVITLVPASANAETSFSRTLSENLKSYEDLSPVIFGGQNLQQLYLEDHDVSVFWNINFLLRTIDLDIAAKGETIAEIMTNDIMINIDHQTGYTLANGKMVLIEPLSFTLEGKKYSINEIALTDFSETGEAFCALTNIPSPVYDGNTTGLGNTSLRQTLFQSGGLQFTPLETNAYSVNVLFVFNKEGESLTDGGSIEAYYPTASGFIFSFGFVSDQNPPVPSYGVGISFANEEGDGELHMRNFETTILTGNLLKVSLTDDFYYSNTPDADTEDHLREITDEIFEGGDIYISELVIEDSNLVIFRMFNPCNSYEFFLVQP